MSSRVLNAAKRLHRSWTEPVKRHCDMEEELGKYLGLIGLIGGAALTQNLIKDHEEIFNHTEVGLKSSDSEHNSDCHNPHNKLGTAAISTGAVCGAVAGAFFPSIFCNTVDAMRKQRIPVPRAPHIALGIFTAVSARQVYQKAGSENWLKPGNA